MGSKIRFSGTGPGIHTQDGCAVELYRRLPADGEAEIVAAVVPTGGTILELGSGPGRVTHALVALGHLVTAVDNSAEMLAHVRGAETVLADIETLDLGRGFDAVLLASTLINFPEARTRAALLATCRRHVRPGGKAQGYVLRKLLRRLWALGGTLDHPEFRAEVARQQRLRDRYDRLKVRHPEKPPEWWFDTHGIDLAELEDTP